METIKTMIRIKAWPVEDNMSRRVSVWIASAFEPAQRQYLGDQKLGYAIVVISINYIVTFPVCGVKMYSMLLKLPVVCDRRQHYRCHIIPTSITHSPDDTRWFSSQRFSDIWSNHPSLVLIMLKDTTKKHKTIAGRVSCTSWTAYGLSTLIIESLRAIIKQLFVMGAKWPPQSTRPKAPINKQETSSCLLFYSVAAHRAAMLA